MRFVALALVLSTACGPPAILDDGEGEGDDVGSIFQRPRARPALPAVASSLAVIDVHSEDELRAALTSLPRADGDCRGRGIRVVNDISLSSTVSLSAQHTGLRIFSDGQVKLSTTETLTNGFSLSVQCFDVVIDNFYVSSSFNATTFVKSFAATDVRNIYIEDGGTLANFVDGTGLGGRLILVDNECENATSGILLVAGSATIASGFFENNYGFTGSMTAMTTAGSVFLGNRLGALSMTSGLVVSANRIIGNDFTGNLTLGSGGTGTNNVISGNDMRGSNITTSASGGGNTIMGNTNCGTITRHVDDAVGLNTP